MTPTHLGDIERFAVLRRSIQLFAPGLPHIAIVNTEDCREFRGRFGNDRGLQVVPTTDVLPRDIERRRRKSGPRWLTGKWLHKGLIKGWHAQQLMKLFALAQCQYEAATFIDSDVFICRPLAPDYFFVDGRLKLFRRRAVNAECLDFDIATHEILGNPLHQVTELYDYIFSPCCFRRSSAQALFAELERRGRAKWVKRFLSERRPSEYNLLGYAATVLEQGAGYEVIECNPDDLHHSIRFPEDRAHLGAEIERMRLEPKDFALIQSTLGVRCEQIANAFETVEEAHRLAVAAALADR
ncbi:MAG TPA: DUF6492 family protein [Steroidobacteraceae bacterium]|nr:DUF6492 family protein [Steroidobacteraceae bacterium]